MDIIVGDTAYSLANATVRKSGNCIKIKIQGSSTAVNIEVTDPDAAYDAVCKGLGKLEPVNLTEFLPVPEPDPEPEAEESEESEDGEEESDN